MRGAGGTDKEFSKERVVREQHSGDLNLATQGENVYQDCRRSGAPIYTDKQHDSMQNKR